MPGILLVVVSLENSELLDFSELINEKHMLGDALLASLRTKLSRGSMWPPNGNARTTTCPFVELSFSDMIKDSMRKGGSSTKMLFTDCLDVQEYH